MNFLWVLTALSIIGTVLNIKKKAVCFVIWSFTNFTWAVVNFILGVYPQAALFLVYFGLAIWGLISWRRKKEVS